VIRRLGRYLADGVFRRSGEGVPALDGIRAIAVVLVVFFHASTWVELLGGGGVARPAVVGSLRWLFGQLWFGVDMFFVLSGFLIGRIVLRQVRLGHLDYRGFYVRRAARIIPAYYLVLVVAVVVLSRCAAFAPLYGTLSRAALLRGGLKDAVFLNNYLRGGPEVMGWAWSLSVEEHFYLVLPLFLRMLFRVSSPIRLVVMLVLPLFPLLIRAGAFLANPGVQLWDGMNFFSHTRCDGLLFGVLLAYLHLCHRERVAELTMRFRWPMLLLAIACLGAFLRNGGVFRAGAFGVVAQFFVLSLGIVMLVARCLVVDDPLTRSLGHPFWYPIARVSYGMYLVHPFVVLWLLSLRSDAAHGVLGSAPLLMAFGATANACTFLVATVLFLAVELPMLRWGARVAARTATQLGREAAWRSR
jgi:peptidoglycan/LPS O-acetylase OafA/YrhL